MRVDDPVKGRAGVLTPGRLDQKIVILREEHSSEQGRTVQEIGILQIAGTVLVSGQHIHTAQTQPVRDGAGDVVIQVQAERHSSSVALQSRVQGRGKRGAAQLVRPCEAARDISVELVLVVPVVRQSGVDLPE